MKIHSQFPSLKKSRIPTLKLVVLNVVFLFSALRFLHFLTGFALNSLQIDFSAFYTAGEALNHGLSPYANNILHSPSIWDGINDYQHSRFLYPPLVATLFQPIARIPYFYAKILWGLFGLLCILLALYLACTIFAVNKPEQISLLGICVCWFYPLLTHAERGQIDALTLLLLTLSGYLIALKKQEGPAGLFLAGAVLLKLYAIYVLPFLIIRKHWQVLKLSGIAISVMLLASMATTNGRMLLQDYLLAEMPRIANYGRPDHGDILLEAQVIQERIKDLPEGYTIKDGRLYQPVSMNFVSNATLVRPFHRQLDLSGMKFNFAVLSFAIFGLFFLGLFLWQSYFFRLENPSPEREYLYWQAVLAVILLSAPLTHVMNTVWMLPVLVIIIAGYNHLTKAAQKLGYVIMIGGMILTGMPDALYVELLSIFPSPWVDHKYLIGEAFVLMGCLVYLSDLASPLTDEIKRPPPT